MSPSNFKNKAKENGLLKILLPPGSKRRRIIASLLQKSKASITPKQARSLSYEDWIQVIEPQLFSPKTANDLQYKPLISVVVPCYNTPDKYIRPLVKSVLDQKYPNWELCLVNGSTDPEARKRIESLCVSDERIKHVPVEDNKGIVGNTNIGLKAANGEYIAFLDHDDILSPHALMEAAIVLDEDKTTDLVYSDEDKLSDDGTTRLKWFFKPDWSPDMLLGVNYITHLVVARKTIIDKIGGLRPGFDGAQDYDFLLRFTEQTDKIKHIPKILYHWREAEGSTARDMGTKNYADTAGNQALADAAKRRGWQAEVVDIPDKPTNYRLRFLLPDPQPKVSIIIPFKDKVELLKTCVPSILKSTYKNYEIILVSNKSVEEETFDYLEELKKDPHCKVHFWDFPFNFSAVNNYGRKQAGGEYLVFLNNDTEILSFDWLEELIGVASQKETGAVGPMLLYPDKHIQHAGVVLGMGGMAGHVFRFRQPEEWTFFGLPSWPRNYLAVTGACLAVKAQKFDQIGGFDEKLTIGGNDVAVGIKLYEAGYRNVYWPFVKIIHYENVSVGPYASNVPIGDYNRSLEYYKPYLENGDPYFNKNLDLMDEQVSLRSAL